MPGRSVAFRIAAVLLMVSAPFITVSCAKKVVETEGQLRPPTETVQPGQQGTAPSISQQQAAGAPSERTLTEEQFKSRPEVMRFENRDIYFDFDKYDLSSQARQILSEKAEFLEAHPDVRILIEGHCDERGTSEYNLALGERRAASAKQYLMSLGISADRISTVSYGEERPLDPGHTEEAWAKNRRAHFEIISF
jgi:peptidoglycan-associated lipoprotein